MMPRGNPQYMKPNKEGVRTKEERIALARKAGIASGKARRDKTKLKDCLEILLKRKFDFNGDGNKMTGAEALTIKLFEKALSGDSRAWEILRDTAGQKPAEKVEQTNTNIEIDLGDLESECE